MADRTGQANYSQFFELPEHSTVQRRFTYFYFSFEK